MFFCRFSFFLLPPFALATKKRIPASEVLPLQKAEPKKHEECHAAISVWYTRVLSLPLMYSMRADTKLIQIYPNYLKLSMRESYEHAQDTLRTHDAAQHAKVKGKWTEHFVDLDGCRLSIVCLTYWGCVKLPTKLTKSAHQICGSPRSSLPAIPAFSKRGYNLAI